VTRPGPERIEPGGYPDGLVVHAYSMAGELLRVDRIRDVAEAAERAELDARAVLEDPRARDGVQLVVYDGDSGELFAMAVAW